MARLLDAAGVPTPACHLPIGPYEVDFAWPEALVALEVDGWAVHGRREAFEADRRRDLHLQALGWRVLHVSAAAALRGSLVTARHVAEVLMVIQAA